MQMCSTYGQWLYIIGSLALIGESIYILRHKCEKPKYDRQHHAGERWE